MAEGGRKAFIVGHPIAHSRSPMIHGHWLEELGIAGSYERIDVAPSDFETFMHALPKSGFVGGNVTIPHKEEAFRLADHCDEAAKAIGAANTLWLDNGRILASNTDAAGYAADLDARAPAWRDASTILVLGAGGAARGVIFAALSGTTARIHVVNRTAARAAELAERFGPRVSAHASDRTDALAADADLLVNTTSLGMSGKGAVALDMARLRPHAIVSDIVYTPLETPLLAAAAARGLTTIDGLGMLLHQAVPGFERWFGQRPVVSGALRAKVVADIEGRS
jgi:shikimate dehydrogenase